MDWKEIQRIDRYIKETENDLLRRGVWDGIRNWNFYQEVEHRMKKNEQ